MNCDPNALGRLAACYRCIPAGIKKEVIIYLLAEMAGASLDGNALMLQAKSYRVIPGWVKYEVQLYLICYWLGLMGHEQPAATCEWWVADEGVSPLVFAGPYSSFASAFTSIGPLPVLLWGSSTAYVNMDGSDDYVAIVYQVATDDWAWQIGLIGSPIADSGSAFTAMLALTDAQASTSLPSGFCTS